MPHVRFAGFSLMASCPFQPGDVAFGWWIWGQINQWLDEVSDGQSDQLLKAPTSAEVDGTCQFHALHHTASALAALGFALPIAAYFSFIYHYGVNTIFLTNGTTSISLVTPLVSLPSGPSTQSTGSFSRTSSCFSLCIQHI